MSELDCFDSRKKVMIVDVREQTVLPDDDSLYAFQLSILNFTSSSLHLCLQRPGINHLPNFEGDKSAKKKFKQYPMGYLHIDIAQVYTEERRVYLFAAIDRTSKFAYAELHTNQTHTIACNFLRQIIEIVPYCIHTVLTDNGIQFTNCQKGKWAFMQLFDHIRRQNGIEHRSTKFNHPCTNGQVE